MELNIGKLPTIEEAENLLSWANEQNPGLWYDHSKVVARAAETISKQCGLNSDVAYIIGLLHDIGRYEGVTDLHHAYAGYSLMKEKGYSIVSRICLTHSFPCKIIETYSGNNDCSPEETNEIKKMLSDIVYDDYDKLIHLCDSICLASNVTLLEVRIIDVVRRHRKINTNILDKWDKFFEIKNYFDKKCNENIYKYFEKEIIDNCIFKN